MINNLVDNQNNPFSPDKQDESITKLKKINKNKSI